LFMTVSTDTRKNTGCDTAGRGAMAGNHPLL